MTYHSLEAMELRRQYRTALPAIPSPHAVFFHLSLMPGWESVVAEQFALLGHVGLDAVRGCIIAKPGPDADRCVRAALRFGVRLDVLSVTEDFGLYEGPTLDALHAWATENPGGAVTYLHTKGASNPGNGHKAHWRRVMMRHVVADWRPNLEKLSLHDVSGAAWHAGNGHPHFCGNFWNARCDWLRSLQAPAEYRLSRPDFVWGGVHSWQKRMYVETWLGSKRSLIVHDHLSPDYPLYGNAVYQVPTMVSGFHYRDFVKEGCL